MPGLFPLLSQCDILPAFVNKPSPKSRPTAVVAKYEGGERRIDVVEFIAIARALGADPVKLF
jgi:hypothetical protein